MKFFDFGAFQKIMKMLSREKYIFHMLFGASHGTPYSISIEFIQSYSITWKTQSGQDENIPIIWSFTFGLTKIQSRVQIWKSFFIIDLINFAESEIPNRQIELGNNRDF